MNSTSNDILPQGYKMTELGPLPEEWEVVRLGDVFEFSRKPNNLKINKDDLIPFIPMEMISDTNQSIKSWEEKRYSEITSGSFVFKNDIIIAKITPSFENGKQAILDKLPLDYGYATTEIWALHPKNENVITQYLYYYLKVDPIRVNLAEKMEGSTGRQRLPKHVLENFALPLPPLPEQQKIAAVLSAVQEAKEKTEAVIDATKALKKSMMKHLFTYGPVSPKETENVPLKETEIGKVPEEWEVVRLGEVARGKITDGTHKTPKYIETGIPFITITNLVNGQIDFSKCKFISKEEHNSLIKRCMPEKDDVLLSKVGTLGLSAKVNVNYDFSIFVQLALIKPKKEIINSEYLKHLLSSTQMQNQINTKSSQSTMKYIGVEKIANLNLPLPPLPTQQKIASILSAIDAKIEAEENRKKALDDLFKSLLHNLMTAKIRVNQMEVVA